MAKRERVERSRRAPRKPRDEPSSDDLPTPVANERTQSILVASSKVLGRIDQAISTN